MASYTNPLLGGRKQNSLPLTPIPMHYHLLSVIIILIQTMLLAWLKQLLPLLCCKHFCLQWEKVRICVELWTHSPFWGALHFIAIFVSRITFTLYSNLCEGGEHPFPRGAVTQQSWSVISDCLLVTNQPLEKTNLLRSLAKELVGGFQSERKEKGAWDYISRNTFWWEVTFASYEPVWGWGVFQRGTLPSLSQRKPLKWVRINCKDDKPRMSCFSRML